MRAAIVLAALLLVGAPGVSQSGLFPSLNVPSGRAPVLDGVLAEGEWEDALTLELSASTTLHAKHADGFLYVGVCAPSGAQVVGNIYIARGDMVEVLHASHALGPATYQLKERSWRLTEPFVWSCRSVGFSEAALAEREAFLAENGWTATVVNLGRTEQMEYQIRFDGTPLRMLFRFDIHLDGQHILTWPVGTAIGIDPGPLPEEAAFDPEAWVDVALTSSPEKVVRIPRGSPPMLDGTLTEGEWDDALQLDLDDDTVLHIKHTVGTLYLGLSAQAMGIPSPCILREEEIWVLHASAALGSAIYEQDGEAWTQTQPFEWRCRERGFADSAIAAREAFLSEEGWLGTIGYLGERDQFEFQIDLLEEASLEILFLFLDTRSPARIVSWPVDLSSHAIYTDLVTGPIPVSVPFDVAKWARLELE